MRNTIALALLFLSAIGLILSSTVHLSTYFGINPEHLFPGLWALHGGIFIVLLPMFKLYRLQTGNQFASFSASETVKYAPTWMKVLLNILIIYTAVNFGLLFVHLEGGAPDIWDGHYVLQNKGSLIRELTLEEYELKRLYEVRGFSGHWLLFYFYPVAAYYSYLNNNDEEIE